MGEDETKMLESPPWLAGKQSSELAQEPVARRAPEASDADAFPQGEATMLIDVSPFASPEPKPGIPLLDGKRAKDLRYDHLDQVTEQEKGGLDALFSALPAAMDMATVTAAMAQILEQLLGVEHHVEWRGAGVPSASARGAESLPYTDSVWSWGRVPPEHHRLAVGIQRCIAERWVAELNDDELVMRDDFEDGMVGFLIAEVFAAFCHKAGWPSLVWGVNSLSEDDLSALLMCPQVPVVEMAFDVACDGRAGSMRALLPLGVIHRLGRQKRKKIDWRQAASTSWWGGLRLCRPLVVGSVVLKKSEMARLRIGDIVIVERHGVAFGEVEKSALDDGARWMIADDRGVTGRLIARGEDRWSFEMMGQRIISDKQEIDVSSESNDIQNSDSSASAVAIDVAQTTLEVRLGAVEMELAALTRLRPGQIIDCQRPVGSPVELVVSGAQVGRGELVTLDGRLGVRILSIG